MRAAILGCATVTLLTACGPFVDGLPLECQGNIQRPECIDRATSALTHSLPSGHPPVARVVVTCDAAVCDEDQGAGQVIVHYTNGEQEVIDFGSGHT